MTRIIAIALQKGGVGKTTTVQHLSHALAMRERKVLMLDLDRQASLTRRYDTSGTIGTMADVLGSKATKMLEDIVIPTYQERLYIAPASAELADTDDRFVLESRSLYSIDVMLRERPQPYDYIIIDTPPGKSKLLEAALVAADEVIVPVQLLQMGFEGFEDIDATIEDARESQELRGPVRLRYRAVLPTFYSQGERISDVFLEELQSIEHPDYVDRPLPLAPMPVPETTVFEQMSVPKLFHTPDGQVEHSLTIFETSAGAADSPTARGQQAYYRLAEYVDGFPT